ncbi:hypothetical protein D1007_40386 [Hordeum vulgare]|nr:hypothetical protein D1007_40386 [Hordeum vulgare]
MVTASSGIVAEAADGLHHATEAPESTYSMAPTGYEAVAATIYTDEAKEKGDEAWHLTGGEFSFPSLFSSALSGSASADNVFRKNRFLNHLLLFTEIIYCPDRRDALRRDAGSRKRGRGVG